MTLLRRSLSAVVVLPVWVVMILTGGQWCLMPGSATAHPVVSTAPAGAHSVVGDDGMSPFSAQDASAEHARGHPHSVAAQSDGEDHASHSTRQEHGPRGCESQAACSVAIAPAPLFASLPEHQLTARPTRRHEERLASLALAPELPPPRA